MEKYNGLTDEQKQQILDCWEDGEGEQVFRNVGSANGWFGEQDEDDLAAFKPKIDKVLASFEWSKSKGKSGK